MSVYYVHNKQAVLDLINRKTTQLPIVAFRNSQDAAKYEGLELLSDYSRKPRPLGRG